MCIDGTEQIIYSTPIKFNEVRYLNKNINFQHKKILETFKKIKLR